MKKLILICSSFCLFAFLMTSCTKEDLKEQFDNTAEMENTASDYSTAESAFEDVFDIVNEEAQQQGDLNGFTSPEQAQVRGCADVTVTTTPGDVFPVTMTLDFGTDGCTLADGREVSGTITSVYTGRIREAGASIAITFDNFVLNGNTINGTKTVTNNGENGEGQLSFTIVVENGTVVYNNGTSVTYETNRTRTWVDGQDTDFENNGIDGVRDDVWLISGTASGVNRNGTTYEVNITTDLRRALDCRWLTSGVLEIETDNLNNTLVIDYGDGSCDDKAMARLGLIEREITMR